MAKKFDARIVSAHKSIPDVTPADLAPFPVITTTTDASRTIIVGVGCRRGCRAEAIIKAVRESLDAAGLGPQQVRYLASADIKGDEPGVVEAAKRLGMPLRLIAAEEIRACRRDFNRITSARRSWPALSAGLCC